MRGRRCEPALIRHTYDRIAAERGDTFEDLVRTTTLNSVRLMGLHKQGLDSLPPDPRGAGGFPVVD